MSPSGLFSGITRSESVHTPIPVMVQVPSPLLSNSSPSDGFRSLSTTFPVGAVSSALSVGSVSTASVSGFSLSSGSGDSSVPDAAADDWEVSCV